MNIKLLLASLVCALPLAPAASATTAEAVDDTVDISGGLLGRTYTGLEFGYTHHVEGAPDALRRWGFVSNRPLIEDARNVDAAFRYNYTRGSVLGDTVEQHDVAVSFVGYLPMPDVKPFVRGDIGWAFTSGFGNSENAFMYVLGAGLEFDVRPRLALAPFINYQDAPDFDARAFWFGARASYRFDQDWRGTFTVQMDDEHNIEYAIGASRRF